MPDDRGRSDESRASETDRTSATYDQIAGDYAARWGNPEVLANARRHFAARLAPGALVLDVGCGPARDTEGLRQLGLRVCGIDRSAGMLQQARPRTTCPLMLADMRHLPVADSALAGLWVNASFLHIPKRDAPQVLREFRRVLRPGGLLYLSTKEGAGEWWVEASIYHQPVYRFFAYYRETELDHLLAEAGFTCLEGSLSEGNGERWLSRLATDTI